MKNKLTIILIIAVMMFSGCSAKGEEIAEVQGTAVMGQVTSIIGNEITIQLANNQSNSSKRGEMNGEIPENMPEGMEDNFSQRDEMMGERPEGMPEGMPEGVPEDMQENMQEGNFSQRDEMSGERSEDMPEGMNRNEMGANMGGMQGERGGDMSSFIELSDETSTYTISVKTPVFYMEEEYTYTKITEENYVSVMLDEEENIVSITIIG